MGLFLYGCPGARLTNSLASGPDGCGGIAGPRGIEETGPPGARLAMEPENGGGPAMLMCGP